jgi:hypothetical protein
MAAYSTQPRRTSNATTPRDAYKLFAPAYGTSLLALGGLVHMVLASTAGEGERLRSMRSSWWDSLGWAAISFGGGRRPSCRSRTCSQHSDRVMSLPDSVRRWSKPLFHRPGRPAELIARRVIGWGFGGVSDVSYLPPGTRRDGRRGLASRRQSARPRWRRQAGEPVSPRR